MRITWSVPVFSQALGSGRGDLVRAAALVEALRRDGHEVRVVEASSRPGRTVEESIYRHLARRLLPARPRLALRDAAWWWRSRGHGDRVAAVARSQRADVLVETQVHGVVSGALAALATGLPLVLDDVSPVAEVDHLGAGLPALARLAYARQSAAARRLVAPTRQVAEMVTDGGVQPAIDVIPNGVDLEAHRRASRASARRALGVGADLLVGFVGSFQPWHDAPLLVRAFADLGAGPRRLLLVGDGPDRAAALAEARTLGVDNRVIAPGAVAPGRIPELLAACDVGVLPGTNTYGQPMKLVEYAAAGLPSVAPALPPVRDVLEDGASGILFAPGDRVSLARALGELLERADLRRRLGSCARQRVASGETWADRARDLAAALEHAVATSDAAAMADEQTGSPDRIRAPRAASGRRGP